MDNASEEGLTIAPDTSKDPLDVQPDANSPSVSSPPHVRLVHVSIPSVTSDGQVATIHSSPHGQRSPRGAALSLSLSVALSFSLCFFGSAVGCNPGVGPLPRSSACIGMPID